MDKYKKTEKHTSDDLPRLFGEIDRVREGPNRGKLAQDVPSWTQDGPIRGMEDEKEGAKRRLQYTKRHRIFDGETIYSQEESVKNLEERLEAVKAAKPTNLRARDKDFFAKEYKQLGEQLKDSFETVSDMKLGRVDPHRIADKMDGTIKNIKVDRRLAEQFEIPVDRDGRISESNASRIYSTLGKLLDSNPSPEALRRDRKSFKGIGQGRWEGPE